MKKSILITFATLFILTIAGLSYLFLRDGANNLGVVEKTTETQVREIRIDAFRFDYNPNIVQIKQGEIVRIKINNLDTIHGISIPDFGVRGDNVVEFAADKIGEFNWYCNNYCGQDHGAMRGKLIVE